MDSNSPETKIEQIVESVEKILKENYAIARQRNMTISLKRRKDLFYAAEGVELLKINRKITEEIFKYGESVKKHREKSPTTIGEFISKSGGIQKCLEKIKLTRIHAFGEQDNKYFQDYLYGLETIFLQIKSNRIAKNKTTKQISPIPFCILCWREKETDKYCATHSKNRNLKQVDLRKLTKKIYSNSDNKKEFDLMGKYSRERIKDQIRLELQLINRDDDFKNYWKDVVEKMNTIVAKEFPYAAGKFPFPSVSSYDDWLKWAADCRQILDPFRHQSKKIGEWLKFKNNATDIELLLTVIRRLDCYLELKTKPKRTPGPKTGSVKKNIDLRRKIKQLIAKQISEEGRTNYTQIAKTLGISKQRVSQLASDLVLI